MMRNLRGTYLGTNFDVLYELPIYGFEDDEVFNYVSLIYCKAA